MKVLVKIGVLLLMVGLLFAAFVLPKFVQRTEPPMPEEDLAAALAAVELGDEDEDPPAAELPVEDAPSSPLRSEEKFTAFYAALDEEDFEASREELVKLSSDLDPEMVEQLTAEMADAISNMGTEESVEVAAVPGPESAAAHDTDTETATDPAPATEPMATPATSSEPAAPSADPAAVVAYFALVQAGDFETARSELDRLANLTDPATLSSMKAALSSAEAREKALIASQRELEKSQQEMVRLQQENVEQLKKSMAQLSEVTKAAKQATEEASRLKTELTTVEAEVEMKEEAAAEARKKPVDLPDTRSIAFGFDSTFLNDASKSLLASEVIGALEKEPRLSVQLRGHADASGPSDYNGILAQARCEVVKDYLLEQGVDSDRISIVSFGETQAASTGGTPEELRRVDVIFRSE